MIAPNAFVREVDALFAFGRRFDQRAVGFDRCAGEELRRLPRPDLQPGHVEGRLQVLQVLARNRRQKSPAVVGSGMRAAPKAFK